MMIELIANTIRGLVADMVEKANSGHPGMPLGTAELGSMLYGEFLKHDPAAPGWPDRDRFVLSAGHGSALLYALLHLTGYGLTLEDLKAFRQIHSMTPGHPEYGIPGVETTTGPLGQGVGNAVGMALAERMLAARFNRPGFSVVDHYTYALAGDGCMMEGVSGEACSLAGHWGLGKLILIYDDNQISIEGGTDLAFREDVAARFRAYRWEVFAIDGHQPAAIAGAVTAAKQNLGQPTLIIAKTKIAKGSPLEGSHEAHGSPLGKENIVRLKKNLGIAAADFAAPPAVVEYFQSKKAQWSQSRLQWEKQFGLWSVEYPELRREWDRITDRGLPAEVMEGFLSAGPSGAFGDKPVATRDAGGKSLNILAAKLPELVGGSADLAPSTKTAIIGAGDIAPQEFGGRNLHFGVREHGMGSILNGMSLHGGLRVYGSTFLVFADYMRPPIRLAALMKQPVIYIFTHDSFWVGEDGPTHQPVEQLESLRAIPGLAVIRPADANETFYAWLDALQRTDQPTALILTRQKLPLLSGASREGLRRGAYVIRDAEAGTPDIILMASGSEVALTLETAVKLGLKGLRARVVSVPCRERFLQQDEGYIQKMLEEAVPRVAIEAGIGSGWYKLVGRQGLVISLEHFGVSGPAEQLAVEFGFTPESMAERILQYYHGMKGV